MHEAAKTAKSTPPSDAVARLRESARRRDPETVVARASATSRDAIDPTAKFALRRVAAVLSGQPTGKANAALLGCASLGYLTGRLALEEDGDHPGGAGTPDLARALRLLSRVRDYDLGALEAALGPLAERPLAIIGELDRADPGLAGGSATGRTVLRLGLGLALAEHELETTRPADDDA